MNSKVLHTLEYNKIIERLVSYATSDRGRQYCERLVPISNEEKIRKRQAETRDALSRLMRDGRIDFSGLVDIRQQMKRLEIGGVLGAGELLTVKAVLDVAMRAKSYGRIKKATDSRDILSHYFDALEPETGLKDEISRCILSPEEIADDASAGLKSVRRQMGLTNEKIRSQMAGMLTSPSVRDNLQDMVITMRNGRYCLPVKAEFKGNVPGMVHDQSSSGSTVFIEPIAVVNLNNQLRELELQEEKEIEKILSDLSNQTLLVSGEIQQDFLILADLDFIFAKGKMAEAMNAVEPLFNTQGKIYLRGARHPLLNPEKVVPIDMQLGDTFNQLIITGPNTGGKTVSLKTCGLLTLMGQAGLHIPAKDRSELAIFQSVYADIGDEQSIEQSLSTFSSHMTNIVHILQAVSDKKKQLENVEETENPLNALVLFDELCAGTDPAEGAALAIAILSKLHSLGVRTMASTHYSELKVYALSTKGVENAACEFSLETLSPTYRLLIGVPGKSNAFAISRKLGLTEDIIQTARERMTDEDQSFEDLLVDLEQKRVAMENDRLEIEEEKARMQSLRKTLDEKEEKLDENRARLLEEANQKAADILREAKKTADETIRAFNKYQAENPNIVQMEQKRTELGRKLNAAQEKTAVRKKVQQPHKIPKELHIGDRVKVLSMNLTGTVHTLPNARGELQVQMGIMRSNVNIRDTELLSDDKEVYTAAQNPYLKKQKAAGNRKKGAYGSDFDEKDREKTSGLGAFNKAASISPEIKLLGMTADEAIAALDKYLDDAYLSHLTSVRIVHGKGTGVLRNAVQHYLRGSSVVKSFHQAAFGEGDAGVTIAEFK